jgi:hypothetical protein
MIFIFRSAHVENGPPAVRIAHFWPEIFKLPDRANLIFPAV